MSREVKRPFTTTMTDSLKAALREEAFKRGVPMGEVIEEALASIGIKGASVEKGKEQ